MLKQSIIMRQIGEFEDIMDRFYRKDHLESSIDFVDNAIKEYNGWLASLEAEFDCEHRNLQAQRDTLREFQSEIKELEKNRLMPWDASCENGRTHDPDEQKKYELDALLILYQAMLMKFEKEENELLEKTSLLEKELEQKKERVEQVRKMAKENVDAHQRWIKNKGPEKFFSSLNQLYASLIREKRSSRYVLLDIFIDRIRNIRKELGEHAEKRQLDTEYGLLVVKADLCDEECRMIVDTGATVSCINSEMSDILGIREEGGDTVELILPDAIRIKAPQILIPRISVNGMGTDYVKAVVLKEAIPGVDGCLGLSFLERFDYTIENGSCHRLVLKPLP